MTVRRLEVQGPLGVGCCMSLVLHAADPATFGQHAFGDQAHMLGASAWPCHARMHATCMGGHGTVHYDLSTRSPPACMHTLCVMALATLPPACSRAVPATAATRV